MSRAERLRAWWSHAFAVESAADRAIDEPEQKLIERVADFLVRRGLTAPALMLLEVGRPLNFVGSQLLVFLSPFLSLIFKPEELKRFTRLLARRGSVDALVEAISRRSDRESNRSPAADSR